MIDYFASHLSIDLFTYQKIILLPIDNFIKFVSMGFKKLNSLRRF